eukprot:14803435-Ditylum_brightwellii.AAC.1
MNDITGWDHICPWTMKTVITKHKARNRHGRKMQKSSAKKGTIKQQNEIPMQASPEVRQQHE